MAIVRTLGMDPEILLFDEILHINTLLPALGGWARPLNLVERGAERPASPASDRRPDLTMLVVTHEDEFRSANSRIGSSSWKPGQIPSRMPRPDPYFFH